MLVAFPDAVPPTQTVPMDLYVLLFTLSVSVLTGVPFGLAPAFHSSNVNPQESLEEGVLHGPSAHQ